MGRIATAVLATSILLTGCTYTDRSIIPIIPSGDQVTLALTRTDDGRLEYCDEAGECTTYPNPYDCYALAVEIDTGSGRTCEVCTDASGNGDENCDSTLIACSVIKAPDPDCVVCAIVGGSVIFSTCLPEEPVCVDANGNTSSGTLSGNCETCFDSVGRPVLVECPTDCSNIACAAVICEDGFEQVRSPSGCCDTCVPISDCSQTVCPQEAPIACPPNSLLVRDPAACCYFYCEPQTCPDDGTSTGSSGGTAPANACPAGYVWADAFPDCGRCVPETPDETYCMASIDCLPDEFCTTEIGDCLAGPGCAAGDPNCMALAVCFGLCRPKNVSCDNGTTSSPLTISCDGELWSDGVDTNGCPLPPTCHCPDGSVTLDGLCSDLCALEECLAPVTACPEGQRLVSDFPTCCGICVPDDVCVAGETGTDSTGTIYTASLGCPEPGCGPGFHAEIGPDCCEVCVRDNTLCYGDSDCLPGEVCELSTVQSGFCQAVVFCEESDAGFDPYTHGTVSGTNWDGDGYYMADECDGQGNLLEFWCYSPSASTTQSTWTVSSVYCEFGCYGGACVSPPP